jgi:UDP-N-acetylglucosamine diphosphorylase/glucosamine-1-phosphate N-acetyltransferase
MMQLFLFEDRHFHSFHPLTLTRPVDDLRVGILTIREKWEYSLDASVTTRNLRKVLHGIFKAPSLNPDKDCYLINARLFPDKRLINEILSLQPNEGLSHNDLLLAGRISGKKGNSWKNDFPENPGNLLKLKNYEPSRIITGIWNLFKLNGEEIQSDIKLINPVLLEKSATISPRSLLENIDEIYIGKNVVIETGAVVTAREGPVYIGDGAMLMAGSITRGPTAICEGSTIKMGAKIYGNTTIGPVCKVGGEVSNVIFHSYSNKAHDGYAGNSLFGQWCNLGADTNTSNLKNNYGTIKFTDWHTRKDQDTGEQFLGTVMGDHSKTGINAMLNTGTNCGVCCNLFSHGYPPKLIPSFSWVNSENSTIYQFDKAVETMERTMARRNVQLTPEYINMMKHIFDHRVDS